MPLTIENFKIKPLREDDEPSTFIKPAPFVSRDRLITVAEQACRSKNPEWWNLFDAILRDHNDDGHLPPIACARCDKLRREIKKQPNGASLSQHQAAKSLGMTEQMITAPSA